MAATTMRRSPLEVLVDTLEAKAARQAELEGEVVRLREAEQAAVDAAAENPGGDSPYLKGRPAYEAREKRRRAAQEIEDLGVELVALGKRKHVLTADESVKRLKEAVAAVEPLHVEMEAAVTEAADLLAQLVRGPWQRYRAALDELVAVSQTGEGIAAEAQTLDPDAIASWRQAVSSALDPVATNPSWLIEAVLAAAFDPDGNATGGTPTCRRMRDLVPDLRDEKLYATAGRMTRYTPSFPFGLALETKLRHSLDRRVTAPVEPNAADAAAQAEREAEMQARFEKHRPFHEAAAARLAAGYAATAHQRPVIEYPTQNGGGELDDGPITDAELAAIRRLEFEETRPRRRGERRS